MNFGPVTVSTGKERTSMRASDFSVTETKTQRENNCEIRIRHGGMTARRDWRGVRVAIFGEIHTNSFWLRKVCDSLGPVVEFKNEKGFVIGASVTCSVCGISSMDKSLMEG